MSESPLLQDATLNIKNFWKAESDSEYSSKKSDLYKPESNKKVKFMEDSSSSIVQALFEH